MKKTGWNVWIVAVFAALAGVVMLGCSIDSANDVTRTVDANVAGLYRYDATVCSEGRFVTRNSGSTVSSLNVMQAGDQLEAIDNNGIIFRGTIGNVNDSSASFNLDGVTTAGNDVLITGTINISGNQGVMRGTWVEDAFFGTVCGTADGPSVNTNDNTSPTNTNSTTNGNVITITRLDDFTPEAERLAYISSVLWFLPGA